MMVTVVTAPKYQTPTKTVCNDCPFRRKALPGWLGAGSPESFIKCILDEELLPCHQTLDYEDPQWAEKWVSGDGGRACLGALVMTRNMAKLPRDPNFPRAERDNETVFSSPREFLEYHNNAEVKSWLFNKKR